MTQQIELKLSPYQKAFYFEWLLDVNSSHFNIVFDQLLYGKLEPEKLKMALDRYIADHLILNSHVQLRNEETYWVKNEYIRPLIYIDHPASDAELFSEISRPFDLYTEPLYRFILSRPNPGAYRFTLALHHILLDASLFDKEIVNQISAYYNDAHYAITYNPDQQLALLKKLNQELWLGLEKNKNRSSTFCNNLLSNLDPIDLRFLQLPPKPDTEMNTVGEIRFHFSEEKLNCLDQLCHRYSISPYAYGGCIFAILLHRYTHQERFALGYSISIKNSLEFIHGAQVNGFLFPYHFNEGQCIGDVLEQAKAFIHSVKQDNVNYAHYPISNLIQEGKRHLLDVSYVQTNFKDTPFTLDGIEKTEVLNQLDMDLFATLSFEQEIKNHQLNYRVKYNKTVIDKGLLENFILCYQRIFIEILNDLVQGRDQKRVTSYALLDDKQCQQVVNQWNQTEQPYPDNKTIADLFESQVIKTPERIALVCEEKRLTYKDLNERASQLAHYLQKKYHIQPDDLVALCLERNEHMLIGILAVLKAGGAYVPFDPTYPDPRIAYMLEDTQSKVLLTNECHRVRLEKIFSEVVPIDKSATNKIISTQLITNPLRSTGSRHLAYVIYTSGTTGHPKGVMLENGSVINTICSLNQIYDLELGCKVTAFTSYAFDVSVSEFFTILLRGGELHLFSENVKNDPEAIGEYLLKNDIDYTFLAPVVLSHLPKIHYPRLKAIIYAGEPCDQKTGRFWSQRTKLYNYYGPTETAIYALGKQVIEGDVQLIGKPINNVQAYVLDSDLFPLPPGAIGELYIGGVGVARGYLNKPELTKEKFIPNPFLTETQSRLYKTGDLVRWLPDGNLEYLGRKDFQVKIRGFRIELSEIEFSLNHYPGITQAVVAVQQFETSQHPYLVGYYVSNKKLKEEDIFFYLRENLPDYMVPVFLIQLDVIPLTANGKTDKNALPKPALRDNQPHVLPQTDLENQLVSIWSEILDLSKERISTNDSFFKLGGNSLLIVKLRNRLAQMDPFKSITLADLFKYSTVQQLSQKFGSQTSNDPIKLRPIPIPQDKQEMDIAIISMSGAFSGGSDLDHYWDLIRSGKEGIQHCNLEECRKAGVSDDLLENPLFVPSSGHVPDLDQFDATFWGMSPNEAKNLDPQIRLFLEHCWYALEESGYLSARQQHTIGVFAAAGEQRYCPDLSVFPLSSKDALATQVSYFLGLTGPAHNIHTACSSSLVTVIEACKNLVGGYCDLAMAGGVSLLLPEEKGYVYQEGMILARDGHCRVFDEQSAGTVPGSGVGVVILKRLSDAKRDGDRIIGVIRGYASNNDGNRKISYTAPSVFGQKECILNAQKMAGISSDMIDYVECHGTGTKLGDPIEVQALGEAFNDNVKNPRHSPCILGSVKANIGHTDTAAGIAGLIKVCKMLDNELIPPQINYTQPNPEFNLPSSNFGIQINAQAWKSSAKKTRMAAISSFGIGGTNAHLIVAEPPEANRIAQPKLPRHHFNKQPYWSDSHIKTPKAIFNSLEEIIYTREWKRIDRLAFDKHLSFSNKNIVIFFSQSSGVIHDLLHSIEKLGGKCHLIDLNKKDQLKEFTRDLQFKKCVPDLLVYFSSPDIVQNESLILYHLLFDVLSKLSQKCEFISISFNHYEVIGQENLCIHPSIAPSMVMPIQIANPLIKARHYDFLETDKETVLKLLNLLWIEPRSMHPIYAIRNDYSWSPIYVRKEFFVSHTTDFLTSDNLTFLITGGMGGVGTTFIEYLISNSKRTTLILLGRRNEKELESRIGLLKEQASQKQINLFYLQCELGSEQSYQFLLDKLVELKIEKIDVVLHAAGVAAKSGMKEKKEEDLKAVIAPKVAGTLSLLSLSEKIEIGTLINFSSLSSTIASPANTEYTAANSFLDEISYRRFRHIDRILTVNLNQIADKGMAYDFIQCNKSSRLLSLNSLQSQNLPTLLNRLTTEKENHFLISKQDIDTEIKNLTLNLSKLHLPSEDSQLPNVLIEEGCSVLAQQIASLFFDILGREKFSVHDSFFDLGGDSLDAIDLLSQLKKIGISLSLSDLVTENTVYRISYTHEHNLLGSSNKIILPLSVHNQPSRNVFFIHPVGGTVLLYLDIVKYLTKQYNYYGIQNINISGKKLLKVQTFEGLSQIYVDEILKVQPEGEYILMGSSLGGTLAYEMANQLMSLGKKVKFIAMFDSWAIFSEHFHDEKIFTNIIKNQAEKYQHLFSTFKQTDLLIEASLELRKLLLNYRPQKNPVNIHLYKAEELDRDHVTNGVHEDNGWQQYTPLPLVIHRIRGTHMTMHFSPGRDQLVTYINKSLQTFPGDE